MDITKISIKRPVAIMMVMFIIIILGAVSITKMEMELTPETEMSDVYKRQRVDITKVTGKRKKYDASGVEMKWGRME